MASSKGPSAKLGCCPARAIFAEVAQLHGGADCGFACASRSRSPQRWAAAESSHLSLMVRHLEFALFAQANHGHHSIPF
jgi:hypothetical protein